MPDPLLALPIPIGTLDFAAEIVTGWIAQVTAQLQPIGIATVEEWYPQAEEEVRNYKRSELPAVWCRAEISHIRAESCGVIGLEYEIKWGVVTESASTQGARQAHANIRENIAALFSSYQFLSCTLFLASGYAVSFGEDQDLGEAVQAKKSPYRTTSTNQMRVTVFYPYPPME